MGKIIDGKTLAKNIREEIKVEVLSLKEKGITPCLVVILVGNDPASEVYVNSKMRCCHELGIISEQFKLSETTTESELLAKIEQLNQDPSVHGILVQLPLPKHINKQKVIESINPLKDVDGFHPINIGRMMTGQDTFLPCTPFGIIRMLKDSGLEISGKYAVVLGRSEIVGKPIGQLLLNENATVTYCHSKTTNTADFTRLADIIIVAVGMAKYLKADQVKPGAIIIDVGINRLEAGLVGDVDFTPVSEVASYISPVPGGVGPMTIAMLMFNTIKATKGLTL